MSGQRPAGVAGIALALLLSGCAPAPAVDLDAARDWLDAVRAAESDGPGSAGVGSMVVGPATAAGDEGIRIDYRSPTRVTRVDARCFGDGGDVRATVTVTVSPAGGGTASSLTADIPCDQDPHSIDLTSVTAGTADALAVAVGATATADTYLHVTLIQELVVER